MAITNLVKFLGQPDDLVWKHPDDNLSTATQVIVNEAHEAVLFKDGRALDALGPGAHTLTTGNIPILGKLVNLPFGGGTPFAAEVWFANKTARRDLRWGTRSPIPIYDPKLAMPVNLRAYGGWGMRVADARSFITQLVGTGVRADASMMTDYFVAEIHQHVAAAAGAFFKDVSVLHASAHLPEIADGAAGPLRDSLARFGVDLINFNIANISLPPEEMRKLQDALGAGLDETVRVGRLSAATGMAGDRAYGVMRSFDTLEAAANNESGAAASLVAGGMGLGVGAGAGMSMARSLDLAGADGGGRRTPAERLKELKELLDAGLIEREEFDAKKKGILDEM